MEERYYVIHAFSTDFYCLQLIGKGMIPVCYGEKINILNGAKCIIMSHGLGAFRGVYNMVLLELVSRGYIVLALEHR